MNITELEPKKSAREEPEACYSQKVTNIAMLLAQKTGVSADLWPYFRADAERELQRMKSSWYHASPGIADL